MKSSFVNEAGDLSARTAAHRAASRSTRKRFRSYQCMREWHSMCELLWRCRSASNREIRLHDFFGNARHKTRRKRDASKHLCDGADWRSINDRKKGATHEKRRRS
jgi:hypothetical protein